MSLSATVARNLRRQRIQRRLTQTGLARKAGISVSYVSMLERGERTPPLDTLQDLADALGVTPSWLLEK